MRLQNPGIYSCITVERALKQLKRKLERDGALVKAKRRELHGPETRGQQRKASLYKAKQRAKRRAAQEG